MTCMTTKQKFEVDDPPVIVLSNGRFAYKVKCPWEGKNGKELHAFKFCSAAAFQSWQARQEQQTAQEEQHTPPDTPPRTPTKSNDTDSEKDDE